MHSLIQLLFLLLFLKIVFHIHLTDLEKERKKENYFQKSKEKKIKNKILPTPSHL